MKRTALPLSFLMALVGCDGGEPPGVMLIGDAGAAPGADAAPSDPTTPTDPPPPGGCTPPPLFSCASAAIDAGMLTSSTSGTTDAHSGSGCGEGGGGVNDVAFQFTAVEAGTYDISTVGSAFDTVLSVRSGCGGPELICNDDIARDTRQSQVTVELAACQTVLVVVDGYGPSDTGAVRVEITGHESQCDDGVDNDGDGLTDCGDRDCFGAACSGTDDWPESWQAFEWEVLELTNQARARGASCGGDVFGPAGPLEMDAVIQIAARGHSIDMGEQAYFEHDSLDGREFSDRMEDAGFDGAYPWAENIAAGQDTPREVVDGWVDSPGHCRNLMNPEYRVIGIGYGYVEGSPYGHYWTQDFAASH